MKQYNTLEEINHDLKRYRLQRDIALEEVKSIKYQLQNDLQPANWLSTVLSAIKKYGIIC